MPNTLLACFDTIVSAAAMEAGKTAFTAGAASAAIAETGAATVAAAAAPAALGLLACFVLSTRARMGRNRKAHDRIIEILRSVLAETSSLDDAIRELDRDLTVSAFDANMDREEILRRLQFIATAQQKNAADLREQLGKHEGLFISLDRFLCENHKELLKGMDELKAEVEAIRRVIDAQPPLRLQRLTASDDSNRLHYEYATVPMFGREAELERLRSFANDPSPFRWWIVTGAGGLGKSRLAWECCHRLPDEWHAGFLGTAHDFDANWADWRPRWPTFMVIDYAAREAETVRKRLTTLQANAKAFDHPVRVLLLERSADGAALAASKTQGAGSDDQLAATSQMMRSLWWSKLEGSGGDAEHIKTVRYRERRADGGGELMLPPLANDHLWEILVHMHRTAGRPLPDRHHTLEHLRRLDSDARPLYASYAAQALLEDKPLQEWSRSDLHRYVLEREKEKFWRPFDITEAEQNLLALATLVGGLRSQDGDAALMEHPDIRDRLPDKATMQRHAIMTGQTRIADEREFGRLEPDILGEIFVLDHLIPGDGDWQKNPWQADFLAAVADKARVRFVDFLIRADRDLPNDPALGLFVECAAESKAGRVAVASARHDRSVELALEGDLDAAMGGFTAIIDMRDPPAPVDQMANAYLNRGCAKEMGGDTDGAVRDYTTIIDMRDPPATADQRVNAYFIRGVAKVLGGDTDGAIRDYTAVINMRDPPATAKQRANAYLIRGAAKEEGGDSDGAIRDYTAIIDMRDPPATVDLRARAYLNRGVAKRTGGDADGAIRDYTAIIDMRDPPAPAEQTANAYLNRGGAKGMGGDTDGAIRDYTAVIDMRDPPAPAEQRARAYLIRGMTNIKSGSTEPEGDDLRKSRAIYKPLDNAEAIAAIDAILQQLCKTRDSSD